QCLVGGEAFGERAGRVGGGRGGVQYESQGAVGLAGSEMRTEYGGLGGQRGPYGVAHGRVVERIRRGTSLRERAQRGAGQLVRYGAGQVEHDRVRLLVRRGLQGLVQRYGD